MSDILTESTTIQTIFAATGDTRFSQVIKRQHLTKTSHRRYPCQKGVSTMSTICNILTINILQNLAIAGRRKKNEVARHNRIRPGQVVAKIFKAGP